MHSFSLIMDLAGETWSMLDRRRWHVYTMFLLEGKSVVRDESLVVLGTVLSVVNVVRGRSQNLYIGDPAEKNQLIKTECGSTN